MKLSGYNKKYLNRFMKRLEDMEDPQRRGREFESFLQHLIQASGLHCKKDIRSTLKEQIDLVLRWNQFLALIEAKWYSNPTTITQLQTFQWRLRQRGNLTIGIFISMSGFSEGALVEATTQETSLLLIDKSDIKAILDGKISLDGLLWEKLWDIQSRKIEFWDQKKDDNLNDLIIPVNLFMSQELMRINNETDLQPIVNKSNPNLRVSDVIIFTFAFLPKNEMMVYELYSEGERFRSFSTLNRLFQLYNDLFGFSDGGSWGIGQNYINWYGFGFESFLNAFKGQKERYLSISNLNTHTSENLTYFEPMTYRDSSLFFMLDIYSHVTRKVNENHLFREFKPIFAIDKAHTARSTFKRIEKLCELGEYDYKTYSFTPETITYGVELGVVPIESQTIITQNLYEDIYSVGVIFDGLSNNDEIQKKTKSNFPLLLYQDKWIGFLKSFTAYPIEKDIYIRTVKIMPLYLSGGSTYIIQIGLDY